MPDLIDNGVVERPFLGVSTIDVTPSMARQLRLDVQSGALVVAVADGSPADQAGIRPPPVVVGMRSSPEAM